MEYNTLCSIESSDGFGLKFLITGNITYEEKSIAGIALDKLTADIRKLRAIDLRHESNYDEMLKSLTDCIPHNFNQVLRTIPNEYCSRYCCVNRPWIEVITERGSIKVGWRKSVISISWDENINIDAEFLFPNEEVTKYERTIHAWGYEKAKEYLNVILR